MLKLSPKNLSRYFKYTPESRKRLIISHTSPVAKPVHQLLSLVDCARLLIYFPKKSSELITVLVLLKINKFDLIMNIRKFGSCVWLISQWCEATLWMILTPSQNHAQKCNDTKLTELLCTLALKVRKLEAMRQIYCFSNLWNLWNPEIYVYCQN